MQRQEPRRTSIRDHLQEAGLGYFGHMRRALGVGARLIGGGVAAVLHGFVPFLYPARASEVIDLLHAESERDRARRVERSR